MKYFVHKSSYIDNGATIGDDTQIWHFSHIMPKAKIGNNCNLGQNIFVADDVIVGDNCKIQNNVSLYKGVIIKNDVFIGPSVVFTNIRNPRAFINRKNEYVTTIIEQGVTIGANATIVCGITIGEYSFIGAGAVVTKSIPPYSFVYGNPAKITGTVSKDLKEKGV